MGRGRDRNVFWVPWEYIMRPIMVAEQKFPEHQSWNDQNQSWNDNNHVFTIISGACSSLHAE